MTKKEHYYTREGIDKDGFKWHIGSRTKFKVATCPKCLNPVKVEPARHNTMRALISVVSLWMGEMETAGAVSLPFDVCRDRFCGCGYRFTRDEWDSLEVR